MVYIVCFVFVKIWNKDHSNSLYIMFSKRLHTHLPEPYMGRIQTMWISIDFSIYLCLLFSFHEIFLHSCVFPATNRIVDLTIEVQTLIWLHVRRKSRNYIYKSFSAAKCRMQIHKILLLLKLYEWAWIRGIWLLGWVFNPQL